MNSSTILTNSINRSKKIALMIAFLLTACASYSFAGGTDDINGEIKTSFRKDFQGAQIISAEAHRNFNKVTFKMNEVVMFAFYADNGELLAVTRNILSSQLPVGLRIDLKNTYGNYWITELIELNGDGQNCYYVSLENADTKLTLRSAGDDTWEVFEKKTKN